MELKQDGLYLSIIHGNNGAFFGPTKNFLESLAIQMFNAQDAIIVREDDIEITIRLPG
jgi:hypothetical protein